MPPIEIRGLVEDGTVPLGETVEVQFHLPRPDHYTLGICDPLGRPLLQEEVDGQTTHPQPIRFRPDPRASLAGRHRAYLVGSHQSWWRPFRVIEGLPGRVSLRHTAWVDLNTLQNGPVRNLHLHVGHPSWAGLGQQLESLWVNRLPARIESEVDRPGSWVVHERSWHEGKLGLRVDADLELKTVRYDLSEIVRGNPELDRWPSSPSPLSPERGIESDAPMIQDAASTLARSSRGILEYLRASREFVRNQIRYVIQPEEYGALAGLVRGEGDCTEMAALLAALCRARNIPARVAVGRFVTDPALHAIAEFRLGGIWLPIDITHSKATDWPGLEDPFLVLAPTNWMSGQRNQQQIRLEYLAPDSNRLEFVDRTRLVRRRNSAPPPPARTGLGGAVSLPAPPPPVHLDLNWDSHTETLHVQTGIERGMLNGTLLVGLGKEAVRVIRLAKIQIRADKPDQRLFPLSIGKMGPYEANDLCVHLIDPWGRLCATESPETKPLNASG